MAIKLHRCSNLEAKRDHACWRVQNALDAAGIEYVIVPGPASLDDREDIERLSGQELYPVIEFEDGRVYREESLDMVARIEDGSLSEMGLTAPSALDADAPEAPVPDR
jgi:hypothetical protein